MTATTPRIAANAVQQATTTLTMAGRCCSCDHRRGQAHHDSGQGARHNAGARRVQHRRANGDGVNRASDPLLRTTDQDDRNGADYQQKHGRLAGQYLRHGDRSPDAAATARRAAAALLTLSSNSRRGTESATIPPPAWTYASPSLITAVRIAMAMSRSPWKSR